MDNKGEPDAAEKAPRPDAEGPRPDAKGETPSQPRNGRQNAPSHDERADTGKAIPNEDLNSANDE